MAQPAPPIVGLQGRDAGGAEAGHLQRLRRAALIKRKLVGYIHVPRPRPDGRRNVRHPHDECPAGLKGAAERLQPGERHFRDMLDDIQGHDGATLIPVLGQERQRILDEIGVRQPLGVAIFNLAAAQVDAHGPGVAARPQVGQKLPPAAAEVEDLRGAIGGQQRAQIEIVVGEQRAWIG